jgi:hypothetical protein
MIPPGTFRSSIRGAPRDLGREADQRAIRRSDRPTNGRNRSLGAAVSQ